MPPSIGLGKTMNIKMIFHRIFFHKARYVIALVLLFLPSVELLLQIKRVIEGAEIYKPEMAAFLSLSTVGNGHVLQIIYIWFMPLYLLVLFSENILEDNKLHYKACFLVRGKKDNYYVMHTLKSFLGGFVLIFGGLGLNWLSSVILFHGGKGTLGTFFAKDDLANWMNTHQIMTYFIYLLLFALFGGLISAVGSAFSVVLKDRKIVYGLTLLIWLVPLTMRPSLAILFQPFCEYSILDCKVVGGISLAIYMFFIIAGGIYEKKNQSKLD